MLHYIYSRICSGLTILGCV